jgi:hypothetical protein
MIGPFTTAPGGFTHVLVAIDKFTKWIEYKPIAKLTPDRVVDFISDFVFLNQFGGYEPQDSGCTFPLTCTMATVTCNTYINRLLVVNIEGAMTTFISFRLHSLTEPSAPSNSSTYRFPPQPWMVARDNSRIFPNITDPFDWFIPSLLDELVQRAASTTSCVVAPRVVSSRPRARHTSGDARIRFQQVRSVRPGPI